MARSVLKTGLRGLAWILGLAVAASAAALAWLVLVSPDAYVPPPRESPDETASGRDELAGWYQEESGRSWLVTWGAPAGLSLNCFEQPVRIVLESQPERDRFVGDEGERVTVRRGEGGAVESLEWLDDEGGRRIARRSAAPAYTQHEVRFRNGDVELAGVLMTPPGEGSRPGVAFIHGSGISDRNNYWYLYQADYLARRGLVVLLPDKRGCGASGGEWHTAGFDDFAGDARAAIEFLAARPETDAGRVGLLGISQGGWIAPLAADGSDAVRFVVNVSGSATTPGRQLRHEIAADIRNGGAPRWVASKLAPVFTRRAMRRRAVWWEKNESFDPLPYWERLDVPALVVYGRLDEDDNVPVRESLDRLRPIAARRPEGRWAFHVYDDLGHGMIDASTGWIREEYLARLTGWILAATGGSPSDDG